LQEKIHSVVGQVKQMVSSSLKLESSKKKDAKKHDHDDIPVTKDDKTDKADNVKSEQSEKSDKSHKPEKGKGHKTDKSDNVKSEKSDKADNEKSDKSKNPESRGLKKGHHKQDANTGIAVTASQDKKRGRLWGLSHNPHFQKGKTPASGQGPDAKKELNAKQSAVQMSELMKKMTERHPQEKSKFSMPSDLLAIDKELDNQRVQRQQQRQQEAAAEAAQEAAAAAAGGGTAAPARKNTSLDPNKTWSSGLFNDVVKKYFNGSSPIDSVSQVAGLQFTHGF
jgi:hypothetical protein